MITSNRRYDFFEYILKDFTVDMTGRAMIWNILDWVWRHPTMNETDSINCLLELLDGLGLEEAEIRQFVN